ncbi:16S rRNA (guanine966-N2)-methyltransferase [Amorphus suaedae]
MRIVGGRFRGKRLSAPPGLSTRPTTDRLRETVFNVLQHAYGDPVEGARVLDLFAGTGAVGLEALSRGAKFTLFVEESAGARGVLRENAETLGLTGLVRIWRRDATKLGPAGTLAPFDLCFADPPYGRGLGTAAFASARAGGWLKPGALCVLEETIKDQVDALEGFTLVERREYGETAVTFFELDDGVAPEPAASPQD